MIIPIIAQLLLPGLLLGWLTVYPAKHILAYWVQVICIGLLIADISVARREDTH